MTPAYVFQPNLPALFPNIKGSECVAKLLSYKKSGFAMALKPTSEVLFHNFIF